MYKIVRATTMLLRCALVCSGFTASYLFVPSHLLIPQQIVIGLVIYFYPRSSSENSVSTLASKTRLAAQRCIAERCIPDEYLILTAGCDDTIVVTGWHGTAPLRYTFKADGSVRVESTEPSPWDNERLQRELAGLLSILQPAPTGLVLSNSK